MATHFSILAWATTHRHIHREVLFSLINVIFLLLGGRTLPGPESELLSNAWKWIVPGDTRADKVRDFIGKGHSGGELQGEETENSSAMWFTVLDFTVIWLVSGCLWPITLTRGPSWWCACHSAKMDSSKQVSGRVAGHMDWSLFSPLDVSWIILVNGSLLDPCS